MNRHPRQSVFSPAVPSPRNRRRRAFTLIELLVVVAIIVSLLAILMPSMSNSIRLAQQTACGSNMRQIGISMNSYFIDNDRFFPGPCWYGQQAQYKPGTGFLSGFLAIYLGEPAPTSAKWNVNKTFLDPAWAGSVSGTTTQAQGRIYGSSGVNPDTGKRLFGYPPFNGDPSYDPSAMTAVRNPASVWALRDIDNILHPTAGWSTECSPVPHHGYADGAANRNYLYFDGHVEAHNEPAIVP